MNPYSKYPSVYGVKLAVVVTFSEWVRVEDLSLEIEPEIPIVMFSLILSPGIPNSTSVEDDTFHPKLYQMIK